MNYYEHHLGDYAEATGHLSFVEDAAYSRMLRKYYSSEKPLPVDLKAVQRLVGARTKEEREAVETVLNEFFTLADDGWHNARCDAEIARYNDKQAKAKRSANVRWNKSEQHTEGNANASPNAMRTHTEGNAHQTPDTRHQTTSKELTHTGLPSPEARADDCKTPTPGALAAIAMREAGMPGISPSHPELLALVGKGCTPEQFADAARSAIAKGKRFAYALGILKGQLAEAANTTSLPDAPVADWRESRSGVEAKGIELGLGMWGGEAALIAGKGEHWPAYKARVIAAFEAKNQGKGA